MKNRVLAAAFAAAIGMSYAGASVAAPAATGFVYQSKADLFGYYIPATDVRVGKFKLNNFAIAGADDFKDFFGGKRLDAFAPVMVGFDDTSSKQLNGELGPYYQNAPRVLPSAFTVSGDVVTFAGTDKQVGPVIFKGKLNLKAIAGAKANGDANAIAMTGDLTVGAKTFKNLQFRWFGGD
jgi:hypothetical protein